MNGFVLQSISGIRRHIETCGNKEHLYGPKSVFKQEKKKKRYFRYEAFNKGGAMLCCGVDKGKEASQTISKGKKYVWYRGYSLYRALGCDRICVLLGFFLFFLAVLPHLIAPHGCF